MLSCIAAACVSLCFPSQTFAWGDEGHEIVGLVADHYLDPAVRAKVNAILSDDTTHLTPDISIGYEATWADKYRDSDRNTTRVHYDQTHNRHFADIEIKNGFLDAACFNHPVLPPGTDASLGPPEGCVIDKINQFIVELKSPATASDEKREALQFLLHFVGDLHQPLHASDDNDEGGNKKRVSAAGFKANNLHHYWDTEFVQSLGTDPRQVAQTLISHITPSQVTEWSKKTTDDWAMQSNAIAISKAYGMLPAPNKNGSYRLPTSYVNQAKASVRLAHILNETLK